MPKTTIQPVAPFVAENEKPSGSPLVTGALQEAGTSSGKRAVSPKKPKKAPARVPEGLESDEDEPPKAKRGKKASKPAEKATKLPMRSVLQFKITLRDVKPEVWRRIQVLNNITFSEFRRNVNEAMGWMSNRSHQFIVYNEKTNSNMFVRDGVAPSSYTNDDMKGDEAKILKEENTKLCKFFNVKGDSMMYEFDMAENWFHDIVLEKVFAPAAKKADYPRCLGGKMACPPEDCGGADGYKHIIKVFNNKNHEEYDELIRGWLWDMYPGFNPEAFNKKKIFPKAKKPKKVWMWLPARR